MLGIIVMIGTLSSMMLFASEVDECYVCACSLMDEKLLMNCSGKGLTKMMDNYPPDVEILDISWNDLNETSGTDIFNGHVFNKLSVLNMSYANIKVMPTIFAPSLDILLMDGNILENMDNTAFESCPFLSVIQGLEMKHISADAFSNLESPLEDFSITIHQQNITDKLFTGLKINKLTLNVTKAEYLPTELFRFGTNFLTNLAIIGQNLQELHEDLFMNLPILKRLQIIAPSMRTLPKYLLHKENSLNDNMPRNLEAICIQGVKSLPRQIFHGQLSLKRLELHGIEDLPSNTFESVTMDHLDLSGSVVYDIPPDWFQTLSSLEVLNLSRTCLESLNEDTFRGLQSLTSLDISGNDIVNITGLIFQDFRNTLVSLLIRDNKLSYLNNNVFKNMLYLEKLDLSDNRLEFLQSHLFSDLHKLKVLSLMNNTLTVLPGDLLKENFRLNELYLSDNPLHCDCVLFNMLYKIKNLRVYGECQSPESVAGMTISDAFKLLTRCLIPIQPSTTYLASSDAEAEPESTHITIHGSYSPDTLEWYKISHKATTSQHMSTEIVESTDFVRTDYHDSPIHTYPYTVIHQTNTGFSIDIVSSNDVVQPKTVEELYQITTAYSTLTTMIPVQEITDRKTVEPGVITNVKTPEEAMDIEGNEEDTQFGKTGVTSFYFALITFGAGCILFGVMVAFARATRHTNFRTYQVSRATILDDEDRSGSVRQIVSDNHELEDMNLTLREKPY